MYRLKVETKFVAMWRWIIAKKVRITLVVGGIFLWGDGARLVAGLPPAEVPGGAGKPAALAASTAHP